MSRKKTHWMFKTKNFGLVIGLFFSLLVSFAPFSGKILAGLEERLLDTFFFLKISQTRNSIQKGVWKFEPDSRISPDIQIVGIDLRALQRFGSWPFPRSVHAQLLDSFSRISDQEQREKSLLLDVLFIEDSIPENDDTLADSIARSGRVFLESLLDVNSHGEQLDSEMLERQLPLIEKTGVLTQVKGSWKSMQVHYGLQTNLERFNMAAKSWGMANVNVSGKKNVVRKQPLVFRYSQVLAEFAFEDLTTDFVVDETVSERLSWFDSHGIEHEIDLPLAPSSLVALRKQVYRDAPPLWYDADGDGVEEAETRVIQLSRDYFFPSITLSLALDYWDSSLDDCEVVIGSHIRVSRPAHPDVIIPVDSDGAMYINYAGLPSSAAQGEYRTFPVFSYAGYARETSDDPATWPATRAVKDKIVLVGAFDHGMADDQKQTPYGMMYGIEIHANILNTLLTGNFIIQPPALLGAIASFVIIMLVSLLASRVKNSISVPVLLVFIFVTFLGTSFLFDHFSLLIDYATPITGSLLSYVSIILYRSSTEEREKRKIRSMFGKYVSPEVVAQMIDNPPELGGVDRELTVFFSDIRGFTSLSETLTPQELVKHLNEYLSAMTDIIISTGGTLDKYVGDEIMCFWGAPLEVSDHAFRACTCALLQKKRLEELNAQWPGEKRLAIGIGINTGIMTVGNMGSAGRMNYTLMGDNVNLGARLEGTNKVYGTMIIVSEYTYAMVKDRFIFRELDTIRVKGKNRPVVIYELVDTV